MKVVAVFVALTVLSGAHGWSLSMVQDQPKEPWEVAVDGFWKYMADINTKAEEMKKTIESSQIREELDTLTKNILADLSMYRDDLQTKLAPFAEDTAAQLGQDMTLLANKLQIHLNEAQEKARVYAEELQSLAQQNADDVSGRMKPYIRKLKKRLGKDSQEIRSKMETYIAELNSRTGTWSESVQKRMEPVISELGKVLSTQAVGAKENLQVLQKQMEKTSENLRITLEAKVEELRVWFQPYAEDIQVQLKAIMTEE